MREKPQYAAYRKPSWAPPSWLFQPVWTVLYFLIAISYFYVVYMYFTQQIEFMVLFPFALNILFNALFTTIQFRLHNFALAALDIVLVVITLVWALLAIYPIAPWVALINLPYLLWVCFATVLQITITALNWKK